MGHGVVLDRLDEGDQQDYGSQASIYQRGEVTEDRDKDLPGTDRIRKYCTGP